MRLIEEKFCYLMEQAMDKTECFIFVIMMTLIIGVCSIISYAIYSDWAYHNKLREQGYVLINVPAMQKLVRVIDFEVKE